MQSEYAVLIKGELGRCDSDLLQEACLRVHIDLLLQRVREVQLFNSFGLDLLIQKVLALVHVDLARLLFVHDGLQLAIAFVQSATPGKNFVLLRSILHPFGEFLRCFVAFNIHEDLEVNRGGLSSIL